MNETFLSNVDMNKIGEVVDTTENNVSQFNNITEALVSAYTKEIDNLMQRVNVDVVETEASDVVLEKYILELSNALYFVGGKLEGMGIKDDLSKLAAKEVFNNAYLNAPTDEKGKKPTVAEITAMAEGESRYETIMNNIYSRAYRQIKYKVDAAYEMLASLRKVLSKRMQDAAFNNSTNHGSMVFGSEE
jgi:hypothetical protein